MWNSSQNGELHKLHTIEGQKLYVHIHYVTTKAVTLILDGSFHSHIQEYKNTYVLLFSLLILTIHELDHECYSYSSSAHARLWAKKLYSHFCCNMQEQDMDKLKTWAFYWTMKTLKGLVQGLATLGMHAKDGMWWDFFVDQARTKGKFCPL